MTNTLLRLRNAMDAANERWRYAKAKFREAEAELDLAARQVSDARIAWEAALMTESPERHEADPV